MFKISGISWSSKTDALFCLFGGFKNLYNNFEKKTQHLTIGMRSTDTDKKKITETFPM